MWVIGEKRRLIENLSWLQDFNCGKNRTGGGPGHADFAGTGRLLLLAVITRWSALEPGTCELWESCLERVSAS